MRNSPTAGASSVQRVVVDANIVIAARLRRDATHDRAKAIVTGIDRGNLPTAVVLTDVLTEVLNYLNERASHGMAVATLDALVESSGFELVRPTNTDFTTGRSLFRRYEGLSLTDAVIAAYIGREELGYLYSFDDDFDALDGFSRLETVDHPYD